MVNKVNLERLIADLVQQLIDLGANPDDLIYTLTFYGYTDKEIKEYYSLPFDEFGKQFIMAIKHVVTSGVCPVCGSKWLVYDDGPHYFDNIQRWNFKCADCHAYGYEEHILTYQGTMISGGKNPDTYYEEGSEVVTVKKVKAK